MALATAAILLPTPLPAQGTPPSLPYSRGFLVTGDYVVGGIDLREATNPIVSGFSTAPISMSGVPENADILAAYLYWETVTTADIVDPIAWETEAAGVQFRGFDIDVTNVLSAKRTQVPSLGAACFGSGSLSMNMFRADVLRFLPVKVDSAGKPTGKRLVNDADLTAQGLDPHTVKLPVRDGNGVPESAGASLVVVYRDQNPNAPLKKVLIYDGNVLKPNINTAAQPDHQGLLRIGDDQVREDHAHRLQRSAEQPAEVLVQGRRRQPMPRPSEPVRSPTARRRSGGGPTRRSMSSTLMDPGNYPGEYGETVQTSIVHQPNNGSDDCVASGAVVFSTSVADVDKDGLPDALENRTTPLKDATATCCRTSTRWVRASAAGQPDIFIEVNAMTAAAGTSYGSATAPFDATKCTATDTTGCVKVDPLGHNHLPTPYALKLVGDAFAAKGIRVHFDVGDIEAYHSLGVITRPDFVDDYTSDEADNYLVPTAQARGGEVIKEVACNPAKPNCHFPDFREPCPGRSDCRPTVTRRWTTRASRSYRSHRAPSR